MESFLCEQVDKVRPLNIQIMRRRWIGRITYRLAGAPIVWFTGGSTEIAPISRRHGIVYTYL
jgi:hypothetical protein